jgi:RNA polymerase sigma-70 factor (ECF subfamily)
VATDACGTRAFAQYRPGDATGTWQAWALIVLERSGGRITGWNTFLDTETLFPRFGLPMQLTA